jgi:hypothetical protein
MEHDENAGDDLDLFTDLPRTLPPTPGEFERIAAQLRREGFFRPRRRLSWWLGGLAAAAVIFAVGAIAGARYARQNSLEQQLARRDLTIADRVLLLQRAGSAYVHAAQSYADATAHVDSTAVEVASRVLLGAAHAVARNGLDAGLSKGLSTVLTPVVNRKPMIWF